MANLVVKEPPEFTEEIYAVKEEDKITAELENRIKAALLNNDVFLKTALMLLKECVDEHTIDGTIHVTLQDKQGWDAKAGTAEATQSAAGLMAAADKTKLDGIETDAEVNQNAYGSIKVGSVTVTANGKTATFTLEAGDNITLTADNASKKINIKATRDGGNADMVDGYHAAHFAAADHGHDGRYYTKTESDNLLSQKAASSHGHNNYASKSIYGDTTISISRKSGSTVGAYSIALGYGIDASGEGAFGEGSVTTASGQWSHAEGHNTDARGICSHSEGYDTYCSSLYGGHAEGNGAISATDECCIPIVSYSGNVLTVDTSAGVGYINTALGKITAGMDIYVWNNYYANKMKSKYTVSSVNVSAKTITLTSSLPTSNFSVCNVVIPGIKNTAKYLPSHAEGSATRAIGDLSHTEGVKTIASGYCSHAEGEETIASGAKSHTEGYNTKASVINTHAEGQNTTASGTASHAEGESTVASGIYSHAEGQSTTASGGDSHAEGYHTIAKMDHSHAEGQSTIASGYNSHAEGVFSTASGQESHAEGVSTVASGGASHAEGNRTTASEENSHAEGIDTVASAEYSHAENETTTASGRASHAAGVYTVANEWAETVVGRHNKPDTTATKTTTNNLFEVGCGLDSKNPSNAFRVTYAGYAYVKTAYNTGGADYAELFEWADGNLKQEDRVGHFVALDRDKVRIATSGDSYILGIVSGAPSVIGNSPEDWGGRWKKDLFGRTIKETSKIPFMGYEEYDEPILDEDGNETGEYKHNMREVETGEYTELEHPVAVDEYDISRSYICRIDRPEWAPVGMLGVLAVYDDGSCEVNGYCKVADGGIATAADGEYMLADGKIVRGYRVIERVADNIVKVVFR